MALLVAIEGIDGSGKGTQATRLNEYLARRGVSAALLSFPRYDSTRFGRAVGDFLNGRFGTLSAVHPQLASVLFAGDRFESRDLVIESLVQHDILICDRYVASNVAHQAAKLQELERADLMSWIDSIEFEVFGMPRPTLTLLLDLPVSYAHRLIACKGTRLYTDKPADLQEADAGYLGEVRDVYRTLAVQQAGWEVIDCVTSSGLRSVDDISSEILTLVLDHLSSVR